MPRAPNEPAARRRPGARASATAAEAVSEIDPAFLRRWPLPVPPPGGDKEARGQVLVVAGALQMPGPAVLAATAALRAGAGKLQIATVASRAAHVGLAVPEAYVHSMAEGRDGGFARQARAPLVAAAVGARSVLIGPGMLENGVLRDLVIGVLRSLHGAQTVVLDAGALTILGDHQRRIAGMEAQVIVTPHAGEMASLLGRDKADVLAHPLEAVTEAARRLGAVTVLKSAHTLVSDGRRTLRNRAGNVGLATSGSGDALAGIIAGLAARGATPLQAAAWGVYLHARAGDRLARRLGPIGYLARELLGEVPAVMASLSGRRAVV